VRGNDLLIWMSARAEGSWQQFRSAVEAFHVEEGPGDDGEAGEDTRTGDLPVYQAIRLGLERLAHVEFMAAGADRRWRVVPPALAVSRYGEQWVGILCGARFPELLPALSRWAAKVLLDSQTVSGMPDRIRLVAPTAETLCSAGAALGFFIQRNAPSALLAAIPPVDDPRTRFPEEPPGGPGWTIHQFSPLNLRWEGVELHDVCSANVGLFRFQLRHQRFHFLRWLGRTFRVPVQVGKYAVLRHRRIRRLVQYDPMHAVVSVPVTCRPPLLIERALVLCSGLLARLDQTTGRLEYGEVPPEIARLAAALLCQEIEIR
jgi:hypothetical protein